MAGEVQAVYATEYTQLGYPHLCACGIYATLSHFPQCWAAIMDSRVNAAVSRRLVALLAEVKPYYAGFPKVLEALDHTGFFF